MKNLARKVKAAFRTRSWRAGAYSVFAAILVIAIAVVVNLAVEALPASSTQLDMTPEKIYSISDETRQRLSALEEDVDVYWLVQSGQEDNTLQQVLERYAEFEHVSVTAVDPVKYPGFAAAYTDESISNNSLLVVCGDRSVYIPSTDVWTYSDSEMYYYYYYYYGQDYRDVFAGEGKLTSAIGYVTSEELPVMYMLTGHGETGFSDSVLNAVALQNIQTESLSLLTVEAVPEDCAVLAVLGPVSDISANELAMIEDYLDGGGRLLVTTEYTDGDMTNFQKLLSDWGMELTYGYVLESQSQYYSYGYIDLLLPELGVHEITQPLSEGGYTVMMPDAQAITAAGEPENITVTALLQSSSGSYLKTDISSLTGYEQAEGDPTGPFLLGAAAENSDTGGQVAVFTSTVFAEPDYSDLVSGANLDILLNAVDWLCEKTDSISIHPKTISSETLTFTDSAAGALKFALVVAVPALFLAAGVVIFIRRRKR